MSKIITCPYCFKQFKNTDVEYQCKNKEKTFNGVEKCHKEVDRKLSDHWGTEIETHHFFKGKPFSLFGSTPRASKCDKCGELSSKFVCPHCHNWLPTEMIAEGSEIISIVGAPDSGKTVYFFNLIRELEVNGFKLGLSVIPKDEGPNETKQTSKIYSQMVSMMYEQHQLPEKTPANVGEKPVPLIFMLSNEKVGAKTGRTIYIVFYDTSGEAFQSMSKISEMANHVSNSAGVIFFVDPRNIKNLQKTIQAAHSEKVKMGGERANTTVLKALLQQVDEKQAKDKPFAIVFSKIDEVLKGIENEGTGILRNNLDITENSSFLRTRKFSLSEINQISEALEKVAEDYWGVGSLKTDITNKKYSPENVKMFAVSSLGTQPDGTTINDINPYRVMDPLVWILHKMGGFDIPTEE